MDVHPKRSFIQLAVVFVTVLLCAFLVTAATYVSGGFTVIGTTYEEGYTTLETARADAGEQLGAAETQLAEGEKDLIAGKEELESGQVELQAAEEKLQQGEAKLQQAELDLSNGWANLQEGEQELYTGKQGYASGQAAYNNEKSKADAALAAGWATLQEGEKKLNAGKEAAAQLRDGITDAKGAAASLSTARSGGSFADASDIILGTLTSTPEYSGLDTVYTSEFAGCTNWAANITRANQILSLTTSVEPELNSEAIVAERFAEQQPQLDATVQAQLEQLAADYVGSQATVPATEITDADDVDDADLTASGEVPVVDEAALAAEREAYKELIKPEIQEAIYAEALAQIQGEVDASLAPLAPTPEQQLAQIVLGIAQNVEGQYNGILNQTAPLNTLVAGISAMDPGLAQLIGPLGTALGMPQGSLDEKRAKIDALATALNSSQTGQAFGAAQQAADDQVATGQNELAAGYATYYGQKAFAEQALAAARNQLNEGLFKLLSGQANLDAGYASYYEGLDEYNAGKKELEEGHKQLAEGKKTLEEGAITYEAGLEEWTAGTEEYEAAKLDAEKQIADGEVALASAESLLTGFGASIETGANGGTPYAIVNHGFSIIPWVALLIMTLVVMLVSMAVSNRIRKKNLGAIVAMMTQSGSSNLSMAAKLYWPLVLVAAIAAVLGICIGLPLVSSILESASGGAVTMDSANIPLIVLIGFVAVIATLLGIAIAASKFPSKEGRSLEPQPTV